MPRFEQFRLPDAGEGLTEAEVVTWHVAVGDRVEVNQPIVEIETAKSLVELPSPFDGVVTEILVAPGTTVDVGTPIITVDTGADDAAPAGPTAGDGPAAAPGASADDAPPPAASPADGAEGAEGDGEGSGAVLVGYGVAAHGALRRRRGASSSVATGTAAGGPSTTTTAEPPAAAAPARSADGARVLAKPPVRRLAKDLGVDLATVTPTGPGGIVTREDVLTRAEANQGRELTDYPTDEPWLASGTVSPDGRSTRVPVRSVRKRTAEAMVASAFTAPHVSVFHTVDVTRTMKLVAQLRQDREFADVRVTPLLIAAKALLLAVRRHPEVNASWVDETQEIVYKHYVNLGIAAQTPRGLVVPNIKDAHRLSLHDLAAALADLTATARAGRTTPTDMSDGTITITNVGVFGIDTGTPILNPGESAILAFGAVREQPWVHKGRIRKRHVTQLALSFDHRLIDGGLGSRLLADVAAVLEDPARGLVWG
ncbi:MAG: 2-oxo acid dehydrogenase subunit E2 [Actinotalea sp.]|nr:2-oxo acid dehydrogenase subunit E2 [Actinotalea sp.]